MGTRTFIENQPNQTNTLNKSRVGVGFMGWKYYTHHILLYVVVWAAVK